MGRRQRLSEKANSFTIALGRDLTVNIFISLQSMYCKEEKKKKSSEQPIAQRAVSTKKRQFWKGIWFSKSCFSFGKWKVMLQGAQSSVKWPSRASAWQAIFFLFDADQKRYESALLHQWLAWSAVGRRWFRYGTDPYQSVNLYGHDCFCSANGMFIEQGRRSPGKLYTRCLGTSVVSKYSQSPPV